MFPGGSVIAAFGNNKITGVRNNFVEFGSSSPRGVNGEASSCSFQAKQTFTSEPASKEW